MSDEFKNTSLQKKVGQQEGKGEKVCGGHVGGHALLSPCF